MNKRRMLVEHKISFFFSSLSVFVFDSIKGSLSTTSCCNVGNEKTKKKKERKQIKLKITDSQTDKREKQFDNKRL